MMSTLQISGNRIAYLELGSGEPVVLLHSSGSSGAQWRALAERLGARYRVIVPDLYGYGDTADWAGRRPFGLECEAEIVLALLARGTGQAHLVGHSYGGAVALHIASQRGDLLRSLTLIEPVAFHLLRGTDAPALAEITEVAERVARAIARGEYVAGFGGFVDYWSGPDAWAAVPADRRRVMAARLPKVALDFHATVNEPIRLEDLRSMAVPTLLLQGTSSPLPTRRICERLAHTLPDAKLTSIPGAGHMAPLTHRAQVNAMVMTQIDAHSAGGFRPSLIPEAASGTNVSCAAAMVT
ncbi:alpha/beta fold hydrolase [Aromatoleum diolicum]|uniref:Alpha/beta fold hydrolase n=1 Tax=Aromatoleum diolicum TaxID=75796 RepID=A0ABX1QCU4_9RHOO|nr:alpha/beta hydrolase [Aromatoleum diolicum]NMG76223.1 alpha/beta fold hydrolase [Aromatoleum diolicum]